MKLSDTDTSDLIKLLDLLSNEEILSLAQTVTKGVLNLTCRNDCIKAIYSFSQSVEELLKRKKISRNTIFQYLASQNISFNPSAEKHVLIDKVVEYWQYKSSKKLVNQESSSSQNNVGDDSRPSASQSGSEKDENLEFARQFVTWFYSMLNESNPTYSSSVGNDLSPVHFYPDCNLRLRCNTTDSRTEELSGQDLVCQRLLALVQQELLLFNPNTDADGLLSEKSAHGLVVVHVCGTIHRGPDVLGVYEQKFGLVKDLTTGDNNWKVKFTHLCIQAGAAAGGKPKLGGDLSRMINGS